MTPHQILGWLLLGACSLVIMGPPTRETWKEIPYGFLAICLLFILLGPISVGLALFIRIHAEKDE